MDDEGSVQGNLASGSHTDDTTPTVVGRATPGSIVKVYVDGKLVDSVIADPTTGQWTQTSTLNQQQQDIFNSQQGNQQACFVASRAPGYASLDA